MIIKQWLFAVRKHFQNYLASINLAGFIESQQPLVPPITQ